jgi:hypothetical protein
MKSFATSHEQKTKMSRCLGDSHALKDTQAAPKQRTLSRIDYSGTSIERIGPAAGLTPPNLYSPIGTKGRLCLEALARY